MKGINIGRMNSIDLRRTKSREDELLPNTPVIGRRSGGLAGQMLDCISVKQILHRRRRAERVCCASLSRLLLERVYFRIDLAPQFFRLFSGGGR